MIRPEKLPNLMTAIGVCIQTGSYLDTRHATQRQAERQISRPDILHVLKTGHHEKKKDQFNEQYKAWNYAVKGRSIDGREIRVIVSFEKNGLLIITAIGLDK
jgi:hypothetical protein